MDIKEMQNEVDQWISQFEEGYWNPLSMLARLTEEVGELAREINHQYGEKTKKPDEPIGDLALELADILFILICYSNSLNIDLEDAFKRVMAKYRYRDSERWTRKDNT
ncbi:nucleotide pyrophosphohydrolase [Pelotomaculum terephthalicicum JT]|uniref:nucleotide pyrophosphohydrolase n=1 Tax=Pelotomaculum TaxID=191373 RepID=UPI0009D47D1B|nr:MULTISPECIES: nucleotide pyrophosphohydrolase [Pelotomaculum]MCG9966674.1 nucleotide pyrophosphohydrolase [Pelotomaculum terephthalicicum JT]OPX91467.1 MAG: MazG nucleotide pyrophosphohydrolase domain protein [Pelotomaculum sp. PtaB.Bin117]OPY63005.1 MAG: MazG nucleotide pyrophosphohydrolase domain protein [Pelotomaculum sp. PtaU1.Bin065]